MSQFLLSGIRRAKTAPFNGSPLNSMLGGRLRRLRNNYFIDKEAV